VQVHRLRGAAALLLCLILSLAATAARAQTSADQSVVLVTTPHTANGTNPSVVSIVVRDTGGSLVGGLPGSAFQLALTGSAVAGSVTETATAGSYEARVTDTVAETVTLTVTVSGVQLDDQPQIEFRDQTAIGGFVTATSPHFADGSDASTLTITVEDENGRGVTGLAPGEFELVVSGSAVAGSVTETSTLGTYTAAITDTVAETVTVTVTAGGLTLSQTPSILFLPAPEAVVDVEQVFREVTRAFLLRRMDQLLTYDPETPSLAGRDGFGQPRISATLDGGRLRGDFALSLRGSQRALAALGTTFDDGAADAGRAPALAAATLPPPGSAGAFDVWAEGHLSFYRDDEDNGDRDGHFGVVYLGADYQLSDRLLLGLMGHIDWARETSDVLGSEVEGLGWMIGPYASVALGEALVLDLRGAWGRSDNDASIDVLGSGTPFDGSFDTSRWLLRGALSGSWDLGGGVRALPQVSVAYLEERQEDYSVSDGTDTAAVQGQTLSLGRLSLEPSFAYPIQLSDATLLPYVTPRLLWDFASSGDLELDGDSATGGRSKLRGALELGARLTSEIGIAGFAAVTYDGIGQDDFEGVGIRLGLSFTF